MYFIPLNQIESVDLVIHALRAAAGEADCTSCPARKVCTKQCLAVADGIQQLVATNCLPRMEDDIEPAPDTHPEPGPETGGPGSHLRIIK